MRAGLIGLFFVVAGAASIAGQPAVRCDRACLDGWLDRYMDAFVAHSPSRLPLARGVKFTENGQRLAPGDATWRTVTGKGGYTLKIADVEYPISKNCARLENGSVTAGDPALVLGDAATSQPRNPATPGGGGARTGCLQQFQSGVFFYVSRIRDRRFVAVDPERGLAFAVAFKIENGEIGPVGSVLHQVPYGMGSGWSSWEETMSSTPRW